MKGKNSRTLEQRINKPVSEERCYEPIAHCLIRALMVPNIYFKRIWPPLDKLRIDIIAIDRAGTGDIHVVEICKTLNEALTKGVNAIRDVPAHYRWVAYQGTGLLHNDAESELKLLSEKPLLPKSGMGRIGVIEVIRMAGNNLGANVKVKAERFKVEDNLSTLIEKFVDNEKADIEFK